MRSGLLFIVLILLSLLGYSQSCTLTVKPTSSSPTICSGNSVVISANASSGTAPYTYSWSTGETTPSIIVNKAGSYKVTVSDASASCQSSATVTITATTTPATPTASDVAVCPNTSATLTATAPGGVYQWYDANGNFLFTGETYTTAPITVQTTFFVEATSGGCTGPRKPVTVYVYGPPSATNVITCQGTTATLTASAGFSNYEWYDVSSGGSPLATGQSFTTAPLASTTTFYVSGIVNGCATARTPVTVTVTQAPKMPKTKDTVICAGSSAGLHAEVPGGVVEWFDVPTGGSALITSPDFTTPALTATTTYYVQVTTGCVSERAPVTVTVNQIPPPPTPGPVPDVCPGTSAHLTATANGGVVEWYARSTGGVPLRTGDSFDTPVLYRSTTYYVQTNNGGCVSTRTAIRVKLTSPPPAPTAQQAAICPGTPATLIATAPGGTYQWFTVETGGAPIFTGDTFTTPALNANTTYYVQVTAATGCVSERTAVDVLVLPAAAAPTAAGATVCTGNSATLIASGANNYQWYDAAVAGNKLSGGQVFVTPALTAITTYYVQTISANGCASTRTAVTVTVNSTPGAPSVNTPTPVCPNSSATLTASTAAGATISWFSQATGGTALATGNSYTTPPLSGNTTYYAEASNGSCVSGRTAVTATIITGTNPQFQYPYNTYCSGAGTVTPTINNPAGGTFSASPAGLVFVSTTTGQINVSASLQGTYTISFAANGSCAGVSTTKFTISSTISAQFSYNGPFCQSGVNPSPVFPGAFSAGAFTAAPSGLVFVNSSTGQIDLSKSAPGTYNVTNTIAGGGTCPPTSFTTQVVIFQKVTVSAGPAQTVEAGTPVQLAGSVSGGATTGTWSGGSGLFSNPSSLTPVYTPASGEGSVTLTLTSADPSGPCGPVTSSVNIKFIQTPAAPTAPGQSICTGNSVTLSATAPGGTYHWYNSATGNNEVASGPSFTTPVLTATTNYYVSTTINGLTSARTTVTVTVTPPPTEPVVSAPASVCKGNTATLTVSNPGTDTYQWYISATSPNLLFSGPTFTTRRLNSNSTYYVQAVSRGCVSARTAVKVNVDTAPIIISEDAEICSGVPLNYAIDSDTDGAVYTWSRVANPYISNPAVSNQTSSTITETLINTSADPVDVTYNVSAAINGCSGPVAKIIVTVYPAANVTSTNAVEICNGSSTNYAITFDVPAGVTWSRAAVSGISNTAVSNQSAGVIREVLFNTTNAPVQTNYVFTYTSGICTKTFTLTVTVKPAINITSAATGNACNNLPQAYTIQSNISAATFRWSRAAVNGISNAAVNNQSGANITESLVNTTTKPIVVTYSIVPSAFGCDGAPFNYFVTVNPIPATPTIETNSPVCVASTILLNTPQVANGIYLWTGPNGFTSSDQNPQIPASAARSGRYFLTVMVSGCSSATVFADVQVNAPPVAIAGKDSIVCISASAVQLAGDVHGGTTTGLWSSSGTGTFSPAANVLNAQYIYSAQDKTSGAVTLTLTSTSKDDCVVSVSSRTLTFGLIPAVNVGADLSVCGQLTSIAVSAKLLAGTKGQWTTSGTGSFGASVNQVNASYAPSTADVAAGKVTLKFTVADAGSCYTPDDDVVVKLIPPPVVNAGGIRYILPGHQITLMPTVSDENVTYFWSPGTGLSDRRVKNPILTGDSARVYTLVVTDIRGCTSTDKTKIVISPVLAINNTFTPNGDGINDVWNIKGLVAYESSTIDIYNRNGAQVFHSVGYGIPWDGTSNGGAVPVGVYYYVIDTKEKGVKLSGWVTVIR